VSRSGLFALIIIAVLTVAGGVYWYMEFVPLSDIGKEQVAEQPVQPVATPIAKKAPAPTPVSEKPAVSAPVIETAPPPSEPLDLEEEPMLVIEEIADPAVVEPQISAEQEVEVTIIPIDDLQHFFETGLFALGESAAVAPMVQEEPKSLVVEADEEPLAMMEEDPIIEGEEDLIVAEEEESLPIEEDEQILEEAVAQQIKEEPAAIIAEVPTARPDKPILTPKWEAQVSLGIPHWQLPTFTNNGLAIDAQFFYWTGERLKVGGSFGARSTDGLWNLDLLGGASWVLGKVKNFSFPVTVMGGPSVRLGSKPQFGLLGRASVGLSYQVLENFSVSLEAALLTHWNVGEKAGFALEAPRISFSLAF